MVCLETGYVLCGNFNLAGRELWPRQIMIYYSVIEAEFLGFLQYPYLGIVEYERKYSRYSKIIFRAVPKVEKINGLNWKYKVTKFSTYEQMTNPPTQPPPPPPPQCENVVWKYYLYERSIPLGRGSVYVLVVSTKESIQSRISTYPYSWPVLDAFRLNQWYYTLETALHIIDTYERDL